MSDTVVVHESSDGFELEFAEPISGSAYGRVIGLLRANYALLDARAATVSGKATAVHVTSCRPHGCALPPRILKSIEHDVARILRGESVPTYALKPLWSKSFAAYYR